MNSASNVFFDVKFVSRHLDNTVCPMHLLSCFEVVLTVEETMHIQLMDREYFIPAGSAIFLEPYERHAYPGDIESKSYIIEFDLESNLVFGEYLQYIRVCCAAENLKTT